MNNYVWLGNGIKAWTNGVPVEDEAINQINRCAEMPFTKGIAVMPDCHVGKGSTVGTVIATHKAILPAATGVDLFCGMLAVKTSLTANDLPDSLSHVRSMIEQAVPFGRTNNGQSGDRGSWGNPPELAIDTWNNKLKSGYDKIIEKYPKIAHNRAVNQLFSGGTGNHFFELCLDENDDVWIMLHSGSRGVGNNIGRFFIESAKEEMEKYFIGLADKDLSYLVEGTEIFDDYVQSIAWAGEYASANRWGMMTNAVNAMKKVLPSFTLSDKVVDCHHNYATIEHHRGEDLWITRKGAVQARKGTMGIIPGSMGTGSFIVEGKGNADSFCSCSHGAGRTMSRTAAKKLITMEDHAKAMEGIEARLDKDVLDESPAAYKDINAVMNAQTDLIDIKYHLRQVLNIKG